MNMPSDFEKTVADIKYHSIDNQNIISWFPFQKKNKILIINPKSSAILTYLKNTVEHVETITLKDIFNTKFLHKYDYIFLEQCDINSSLQKIFQNLSECLKPTGIIFFPFSNQLGVNSLISTSTPDSYIKHTVTQAAKNSSLKISYYNIFPNHFIPEIIFSDEYLSINRDLNYTPLNLNSKTTSRNEPNLFKIILESNDLTNHSNSYLAIITKTQKNIIPNLPQYIKFNNYRKPKYNLTTYFQDHKYYKQANFPESKPFLQKIIKYQREIKDLGFKILDIETYDNKIFSEFQTGKSLIGQIHEEYQKNPSQAIKTISHLWNEIKSKYQIISVSKQNIFKEYQIKISSEKIKELHFVPKLYIDMIPQNVIVNNNQYIFYDQEWVIHKAPLEFLLYRILSYVSASLTTLDYNQTLKTLLDEFQISKFQNEFSLMDKRFIDSVYNNWYKQYIPHQTAETISTLEEKIKSQKQIILDLNKTIQSKDKDIRNILSSTSWRITKPIRTIKKFVNQK